MKPVAFKRHRFPADVIRYAVWLYFRFSLSFRDVGELLAQRGIDQLRDDPLLDRQVWVRDRQAIEATSAAAVAAMASG